ncbi:MAG: fluoride efflux transporter FluC [Oceanococcaceae bacterium]
MNWLAIACGGAVGSLLRAALARWQPWPGLPLSILAANVLGSLAIGLLWAWCSSRAPQGLAWQALGVGLLGGFTTYSTFSLDVLRLLEVGRLGAALGYALATLVLALAACGAGILLGRQLFPA